MGLGRTWSKGHGNEFAILTEAFSRATGDKIARFRAALKANAPIMEARAILHEGVSLARQNKHGVDLCDWDPAVTQFRWYDPEAKFWLQSDSTPHQVDAIMRKALLACCDLWDRGCRDIRFCGICEQEQFRIRYNTVGEEVAPKEAHFWVEVPDHWASYDETGRDGEERDVTGFLDEWGAATVPSGVVVHTEGVRGRKLHEGDPFDDEVGFAGDEVTYRVIEWQGSAAGEALAAIAPPVPAGQAIPPSELRRLERMHRLAQVKTWTIRPSSAAALTPPPTSLQPAPHGTPAAGVPDAPAIGASAQGRYGRLFPHLIASEREVEALRRDVPRIAEGMLSAAADAIPKVGYIDAGYTFLGQFIDHDLTFDSSSSLERALDPDSLVDYRTPRLDLDSIYGGGPAQQPYLFDDNGRFVLGNIPDEGGEGWDLARSERGVAITVDPRNDQHAILSQLTVLFLRFHNALVDGLDPDQPGQSFTEAQTLVRWHYQWLVLHHFLPAVIGANKTASYLWVAGDHPTGPQLVRALLSGGLKLDLVGGPWGVFMPVEFSAAAFRFGHSLILPSYRIEVGGRAEEIIARPGLLDRRSSVVDWRLFVRGLSDEVEVQQSAAIDTKLLPQFGNLGGGVGLVPNDDLPVSLPERTLTRGLNLHLPSGQSVARNLKARGYRDVEPLPPAAFELGGLAAEETPLWYYILREAELTRGGACLGPVGGTLVAEVLLGLLVHDESSFLHAGWAPEGGDFSFADLVRAAESWSPDSPAGV